jgi:2-oxoglutarate ferredoxin oxidoreductase subunit alpha
VPTAQAEKKQAKLVESIGRVTIRFAGDSGDGIQLSGNQFTLATAIAGNDLGTHPDYPAEIRAPAGTTNGVSSFQISFSERPIHTAGDEPDVLVALNPAALKVHVEELATGGIIVANADNFTESGLTKAKYKSNPLEDGSLSAYRVLAIPINSLNTNALDFSPLDRKSKDRCRNFYALGLVFWMYDRPLDPTLEWIAEKFAGKPDVIDANQTALKAGYNYADTTEIFTTHYTVRRAPLPAGEYRNITGTEALVLGLITASQLSHTTLFYGSYPITPASDILHSLAAHKKDFGVRTFQAEDEIAAVCAAIGASYAGDIGVTGTSGPGMALKAEAIGLAVMAELPLIVINIQRAGPSTGLPTKAEQSDLLQACVGRNGDCPVVVLAPATSGACFDTALEAVRIATKYMTPVIILSDGFLTNASEPWPLPDIDRMEEMPFTHPTDPKNYLPYRRDPETLSRPWAVPGNAGFEHRVGGLEKEYETGNVNYEPKNHERMVKIRDQKIRNVAKEYPPTVVYGEQAGDLLIVGWGSTYGAIMTAVENTRAKGRKVSYVHLHHVWPFPNDLGDVLKRFKTVLVPELNMGQMRMLLRGEYGYPVIGLNKTQGRPFKVSEIEAKIEELTD